MIVTNSSFIGSVFFLIKFVRSKTFQNSSSLLTSILAVLISTLKSLIIITFLQISLTSLTNVTRLLKLGGQ